MENQPEKVPLFDEAEYNKIILYYAIKNMKLEKELDELLDELWKASDERKALEIKVKSLTRKAKANKK